MRIGGEIMHVDSTGSNFAHKLLKYLQEADYRVADSKEDREAIFKLRYDAYMREGAIQPNNTGLYHDAYDDMDNCWIFGIFLNNLLASSIRCHIISPDSPKGPALDVFPDIVRPMLDQGQTLIDPTRFVRNENIAELYPEIPFMTLRAPCMASEYFEAEYCLATVRKEHAAFYKRVFKSEILCEPRPYPGLKAPICLLKANVSMIRNKLMTRFPIFESSLTERRMIFGERNTDFDMPELQGVMRQVAQ